MPDAEVLIVIPLMDLPTIISTQAGDAIIRAAGETGWKYTYLFGLQALRPWYEMALWKTKDIRGIFYVGHGTEDSLVGNHLFFRLADTYNANLMKDKIVYTMACLSGITFGPEAVSKGCRAYFGHKTLYYAQFPEAEHNYMNDWIDYVSAIPKALMQGKTCQQAFEIYQQTINNFIAEYNKLREQYPDAGPKPNIDMALSNLEYYTLLGNPDAALL